MKQHAVRIALGLAVLAAFLGHAAKFYRIPFVDQLDAYEPLGLEAEVGKARAEELKLWAQALKAYRSQAGSRWNLCSSTCSGSTPGRHFIPFTLSGLRGIVPILRRPDGTA